MGAWEVGSFGNDPALDWLIELYDIEDPAYISETLERIPPDGGKPEFYDCRDMVAAAEIVAILMGRPPAEIPEDAADWLAEVSFTPPPALAELARRALERIKTHSELRDEWATTKHLAAWVAAIEELEQRLRTA